MGYITRITLTPGIYFSSFQALSTFQMTVWILFIHLFLYASSCQPPDVPEGGSYKPEKSKYLAGDKIVYTCKDKLTRIGKDTRTCQTTGKWTGAIPFCDSPVKIRNPSVSTHHSSNKSLTQIIIDGKSSTCYVSKSAAGVNLRVFLDQPAPVNVIRIYFMKGKVNFSAILKKTSTTNTICTTFERDLEEEQWVTLECADNKGPTESVTIQDISDRPNFLALCEVEVYVKDDVWCKHPPDVFIPNGYLEVSRDKATLRCSKGFKEKDNTRLVCENNSWAGPNLQCESDKSKKENAFKIIAISVGCVVVLLILFLLGLTIFLIQRKRSQEVVVIYKPGEDGYAPASPATTHTTGCSEAEYSAVYYDAIASTQHPSTPTRPPHLSPKLQRGYSRPADFQNSPLISTKELPADIAFGTLKSSELYKAMN